MNNLYNDLVNLVNNTTAYGFTSLDISYEDKVYRIFDYGITSWTEFQKPNAVNCRGTMFDITDENNPVLVSLPPEKFFNFHEGTCDHVNDKEIRTVMVKRDGSLISTYLHNNELLLKSKGHLFSDQAKWANQLLNEKYSLMKNEMFDLVKKGYTVNMEYTAPNNTIVVFYSQEELKILSAREHKTGYLFYGDELKSLLKEYPEMLNNIVEYEIKEGINNQKVINYINDVLEEQEGEGYVIEIKSLINNKKYLVKIKNNKYVLLHHAKASFESPIKIIECILENQLDDLRGLFKDDKEVQGYLDKMEILVVREYNKFVNKVTNFYEANKSLEIKEYAINAEKELGLMKGLAFNMYKGKECDFKSYLIKHKESFFPEIKFNGEKNYRKAIM